MLIGYARVSTSQQETDLQITALKRAGCRKIVHEKTSSVGKRPELHRLLEHLVAGDELIVWKIDRLARSLSDLLRILDRLEGSGASFRSLTEPVDTCTPAGRLMLQMLGAMGEFERALIRERSIAGQQEAMRRGVHCGRPRVLLPDDEPDIQRLYLSGWYTLDSLAMVYDVHPSVIKRTIYRKTKPGHSSLK